MNTKTLDKEQHDLHALAQDQRYIGHSTERPSARRLVQEIGRAHV